MKEHEEMCKKYEGTYTYGKYVGICRYIGFCTAHLGCGTWKNADLIPLYGPWDLEKFRAPLSCSLWDLEEFRSLPLYIGTGTNESVSLSTMWRDIKKLSGTGNRLFHPNSSFLKFLCHP